MAGIHTIRFRVSLVVALLMTGACHGCSETKEKIEPQQLCAAMGSKNGTCEKIEREIEIGMSKRKVKKIMKPLVPKKTEIPAIYYEEGKDTGYFFAFVNIDDPTWSKEGLNAVFVYKDGIPATYLLPREKKGTVHKNLEALRQQRRMKERAKKK
jgi:hypothetical protein